MEIETLVRSASWLCIAGYLLCVAAWRIFWHNDNNDKK